MGSQPTPTGRRRRKRAFTCRRGAAPVKVGGMTAFIVVMASAIVAGWFAERIRVPYPIVLVLAGIGVGLAYGGLGLDLDPEIVLAVVLPAVLYPAAVNTSWRD